MYIKKDNQLFVPLSCFAITLLLGDERKKEKLFFSASSIIRRLTVSACNKLLGIKRQTIGYSIKP